MDNVISLRERKKILSSELGMSETDYDKIWLNQQQEETSTRKTGNKGDYRLGTILIQPASDSTGTI